MTAEKSFFTDYIEIAKRLQSAQKNIELSEKSTFSLCCYLGRQKPQGRNVWSFEVSIFWPFEEVMVTGNIN